MSVIDKAVSTEDLCAQEVPPALTVLRLEAILNTLVENKVEALKQENKASSLQSSPKSIIQKMKFHTSPKATLSIENEKKKESKRKDRKEKNQGHKTVSESRQFKRQVLRQETSSPDSQGVHGDDKCQENGQRYRSASCVESSCPHGCYCSQGPMSMQMTDDYISIKMDGFGDIETDTIIAQEELRKAKRKRRRRRRRRLKKRLALNPHLVDTLTHDSEFKSLNDDELPPRAKWTIVATACLLLFMCLLLVGITLRMAPIIDEIGHKRLKNSRSLEEIYCGRKQRRHRREQRRKSDFLYREKEVKTRKKGASTKSKKNSVVLANRKNNIQSHKVEKGWLEAEPVARSKEETVRQESRRKIINVILGVYLLLFCVSILSVVVTLTHTSTALVSDDNNSTRNLTYYTFSPNPQVLDEDNR